MPKDRNSLNEAKSQQNGFLSS